MQAGRHMQAYALLENSMNIELAELGGRPERMVELYNLAGTIYDEVSLNELSWPHVNLGSWWMFVELWKGRQTGREASKNGGAV